MNKEFIFFLIVKDKEYKSKNGKVNINIELTKRMDCMLIFKYKHTIDLRYLCLDLNRLISIVFTIVKFIDKNKILLIKKLQYIF